MPGRAGQGNNVADGRRLQRLWGILSGGRTRRDLNRNQHNEANDKERRSGSGWPGHAFADALSGYWPEAPPEIDFSRCGSFS